MRKTRTYRLARYIVYRQTILEPIDHLWTFIGAFVAIALIGVIQQSVLPSADQVFLVGSFGATAVLLYGASNSPLAQPRNLFGGHLISAVLGVTTALLLPGEGLRWIAAGFAVASSIVAMQVSKTLHPPGGATALIAVIGSEQVRALGYWYVLSPILVSISIMFLVAMVFNNLPKDRSYPYRGPWTSRTPKAPPPATASDGALSPSAALRCPEPDAATPPVA